MKQKLKYIKDSIGVYTPDKKYKIKRTVYFTNHQKILKYIEAFARKHGITVSSTILGFVGLGLMVESIKGWRRNI